MFFWSKREECYVDLKHQPRLVDILTVAQPPKSKVSFIDEYAHDDENCVDATKLHFFHPKNERLSTKE